MTAGLFATDPVVMGPYRLLGRLGGGGMGQVYLGASPGGRLVAVKVIRPELAADEEFRARFGREVTAARKVSGMFTAVLIDAETDGPVPWLATAYVAGPPLSTAVRESGPLPLASLLPLAAGLTEALSAIHAAGLVHRDLKPSNVLLAADGPRVIDFGIAHAVEASALTETGAVMGSPGYMAPEQAQGQAVGPASDIFSLGAVLAYAAAGRAPFGGGPAAALLYRVVNAAPDLTGVPRELRSVIERCLAKDPAARPSLSDVLSELGGQLIPADWLPTAIADRLTDYQPGGRLAPADTTGVRAATAASELAEGSRGVTEPPAAGAAGAPPAGRRGRLVAAGAGAVALVTAVILAILLSSGTGSPGRPPNGAAPSLLTYPAGRTPGANGAASGAAKAAAEHGSPTPPRPAGLATARHPGAVPAGGSQSGGTGTGTAPSPTAAGTGTSPSSPTPAATRHTTPAASPPASATGAGPTGTTSSNGVVSATDGIVYSCSNYPVSTGPSDTVSVTMVNNTSDTLTVYYVETSTYAGLTGSAAAGTTSWTLVTGGVYQIYDLYGGRGCLGVVKINGPGTITIS
jgi:hypothetical protein